MKLQTLRERWRESLFVVPLAFIVAGVVSGELLLRVDGRLGGAGTRLPLILEPTVDGSRALLTTVATATLTVAGIAFSIALLVFQMASSQFSPRSIESLFRDPYNKRVIGLVVGTFAYCLIVLRAVRGPLRDDGEKVVPGLSVSVAVLLGLASLLAIVAFINHSAHSMKVSELLRRITDEAMQQTRARRRRGSEALHGLDVAPAPAGAGMVVRSSRHGWVQYVDCSALLEAVDDGGVIRLDTAPGRFVLAGTPLCTVWPAPSAPDESRATVERVEDAVQVGRSRTMQQDPTYGIRQLTDVALVALSPGVNDPTTAQDAMFHVGAVLLDALAEQPQGPRRDGRGRVLIPAAAPTRVEIVRAAFDELRRDAATRPTVCVSLLELLHLVATARAWEHEEQDVHRELRRQARLVLEGCEAAPHLPEDIATVRAAYGRRFGGPAGGAAAPIG